MNDWESDRPSAPTVRLSIACVGNPRVGKKTLARRILGLPETRDPFDHRYTGTVRLDRSGQPVEVDFHVIDFGSTASEDHVYDLDNAGSASQFGVFSNLDALIFLVDPRPAALLLDYARLEMVKATIVSSGKDDRVFPFVFTCARADVRRQVSSADDELRTRWEEGEARFFNCDAMTGEGVADVLDAAIGAALRARELGVAPLLHAPEPHLVVVEVEDEAFFATEVAVFQQNVEQGDWEAVTAALLQVWRRTRASDIALLLNAVAYRWRSLRPPSFSHAWWVASCRRRRLTDLPVLLDTLLVWERPPSLTTRHRKTRLARHFEQVVERLEGLCWWEDDARITSRLASALVDLSRYRRVLVQSAICRLLRRHADPRAHGHYSTYLRDVETIRRPLVYRDPRLIEVVSAAAFDLREAQRGEICGAVSVPPEHQDVWQSLVERIRRPLPRAEDMGAVAADPKNDDVRREVAERMRERGDPRGEFILLQLKKAKDSLSPDEHEREQALKRTYAWDWLGPLADVVDVENSVFEKGYPVKLTVWTPNTRALNDVIGKPEWATVRELRWGGDPCWEEEAPDAALVEHPIMRSLEKVTTKMPEDPAELEALRRVAWAR